MVGTAQVRLCPPYTSTVLHAMVGSTAASGGICCRFTRLMASENEDTMLYQMRFNEKDSKTNPRKYE
jgi:hypothetical protein